jgi:ATP-dependent DNA helicase RecG
MPETQNIEWKASWRDEYLKWICGFANAKGGKIYIGKDDTGNVVGVEDFQKQMEDLPNKISNHLGIMCDVNLHEKMGKHYIEIVVSPYDVPISYHGKYYFRSGSTKQELQGTELNKFLLRKTGKTWDDVIEPDASFDDIDINAVEAFKKEAVRSKRLPAIENENDIKRIFENLKLTKKGQLKRSSLLLFGKDPRDYVFNSFAKIGKFGKSDDELLSQDVIEGNAFQLADKILDVLETKYLVKNISYEGLYRIETLEYPYEAVREALLNAIIHRDYTGAFIQISVYDDKLMIWSHGILPDEISLEDLKLKHSSYPRNPILADVFFKAGLIEAWGRGTLKIINECKKMGLPEPEINIMTGGICVTFFKDIYTETRLKKLGLNNRQVKAVLYTKENSKMTNKIFQKINNVSKRTATNELNKLVEEFELLKKIGSSGAGISYTIKNRAIMGQKKQ